MILAELAGGVPLLLEQVGDRRLECRYQQYAEHGMADPGGPQQHPPEAQSYRSPHNDHGSEHVVAGDPDAHRQTGGTADIITSFQTGQPKRKHPCAEESRQDCCDRVRRPSEQQ